MLFILWIIEVFIGLLIILAVLMQVGRGEGLGTLFGGAGTQSIFGPTGPATLLEKITYALIALFFINTIAIAKLSTGIGKIETPQQVIPEAPSPEEVLPDIPQQIERNPGAIEEEQNQGGAEQKLVPNLPENPESETQNRN